MRDDRERNARTQLYNTLMGGNAYGSSSRYAKKEENPLFAWFDRKGKSAENAIGTTLAAIGDFFKSGIENTATQQNRADNKSRMNDIAKRYGYNTWSDWQDANAAARESGDTEAIKKFDEQTKAFQTQANENKARTEQKAKDYENYRDNSYASQKVNQDRGKFAGSAINTLSTGVDVASMLAGGPANPLVNTVQGGVEGLADELEEHGFKNFSGERAASNALAGAAAGLATGGLNKFIGGKSLVPAKGKITGLASKALNSGIGRGSMSGAVGGAVGAGTSAALNGQDILGSALEGAKQGAIGGAVAGGVIGGANRLTNSALNKFSPEKAQKMQKNAQAWDDWKNSGGDFNERLTNTLTSGDSKVGDWLLRKNSSNLLGTAGGLGNRVQNVPDMNSYIDNAMNNGATYDEARLDWEDINSGALRGNTPTTAKDWLKQAGKRAVEDLNNTNLGNRVQDANGDLRNRAYNDLESELLQNRTKLNGANLDASTRRKLVGRNHDLTSEMDRQLAIGERDLLNKNPRAQDVNNLGYDDTVRSVANGEMNIRDIPDEYLNDVVSDLKVLRDQSPPNDDYYRLNNLYENTAAEARMRENPNYVGVNSRGQRTEYTPEELTNLIREYDNYKAPNTLSGNSSSEVFDAVGPAGDELMTIYKTMNGGREVDPYNRRSWGEFEDWLNKQRPTSSSQAFTMPREIMDAYQTISSRYNDPSKMSFETTPKGNTRLYYDGKDTGSTYRALPDDIKEDLRLEGLWREQPIEQPQGNLNNPYSIPEQMGWDDITRLSGANPLFAKAVNKAENDFIDANRRAPSPEEVTENLWDDIRSNYAKNLESEVVNSSLDSDGQPTNLSGWLKQAGSRALEDLNDKGVGLSLKKVDNQQFPEDIRNMQINDGTQNQETQRFNEVANLARNNELGQYNREDIKNIYQSGDQDAINALENAWRESALGEKNANRVIDTARNEFINKNTNDTNPQTQVYRTLQQQEPIDLNSAFETNIDGIQQRNRLQATGQQLQKTAQNQKYKAIFDSLDAKTAKRAAETNAPQKLADLDVRAQDYNEYAKTSSYINRVMSDLADKSGVKVNAPDLPSQLSADNIDVVMSDTALRKYNDYIKKIVPDGDSPSQYSAGYLLRKSRELGNKAANLRGNTDDVIALRQALTDAKWTIRDLATSALENSKVTGDATNDMIAEGLRKLGANEKVQDYYTDAVDGKAPSVADYIRRSSLFEQAREMGNQIDAEKYTRSASKSPTNPMTKIWRASGFDDLTETALNKVVAPISAKAMDLTGKALEKAGNVQAGQANGEGGIMKLGGETSTAGANGHIPSQAIWNQIGRNEGNIQGEQASRPGYVSNANEGVQNANTLEDLAVPGTGSSTSVYDSMYGVAQPEETTATQPDSLFPTTGDYWTDLIGVALTGAINDNDAEAFKTLYAMYQDAASQAVKNTKSSSSGKMSDTQRRAYAAENALGELSNINPDFAYNVSNIPVLGNIATLGGNQYKSAANSLATQIGYMMSGANITPAEAERIGNSYVPQPFDNDSVRAQKLQRARAIIERYKGGDEYGNDYGYSAY